MNNRKVDMDWLSNISKISNGSMEANTVWTIPAAEFTLTLATTALVAHNNKKEHHK
ncbi:hypothetical protein [Levilactobacillus parabrevis]|uniref:hypothetical protein n=1 Tax=Levilactobacillus parabrevis TaxID=357278 RepID=UPI0021A8D3AC|nr:hypothetical protein [Levilactobacillus parabrevis]